MNYMDILTILRENLRDLLYISAAIASFFLGKRLKVLNLRKTEVDVKHTELENIEVALKIYRTMLSDLQTKLQEAEEAYEVLAIRLQETLLENKKLKKQLDVYTSNSKQI